MEPDDGDDEEDVTAEDPKRCKLDTPTVVVPANSSSVVEPAASRTVEQPVQLLPRGRGRGRLLRSSLSQTIPAALPPSQVEFNLPVSRTCAESSASATVGEPATLKIVVEPSTSRTVVEASASATVVEPATLRIAVEPSTSRTVVGPSVSANVVEPGTSRMPRGRGKGMLLRSSLTQTIPAALPPSPVEVDLPVTRSVQDMGKRKLLVTITPGQVEDAVVDQPVKERNVATTSVFVKEEPMDLDPKYENFQVSLNYNFESDDHRASYLPDDFDDDMPDVPLPSPGDMFFD